VWLVTMCPRVAPELPQPLHQSEEWRAAVASLAAARQAPELDLHG